MGSNKTLNRVWLLVSELGETGAAVINLRVSCRPLSVEASPVCFMSLMSFPNCRTHLPFLCIHTIIYALYTEMQLDPQGACWTLHYGPLFYFTLGFLTAAKLVCALLFLLITCMCPSPNPNILCFSCHLCFSHVDSLQMPSNNSIRKQIETLQVSFPVSVCSLVLPHTPPLPPPVIGPNQDVW